MWSRRSKDRPAGSPGFMLIEALVAISVAAVLLAVLMQGFSSVWRSIGDVREETEAMLVARAVLEATAPRLNLAPGAHEGVTGRYAWSVGVVDTQRQMIAEASNQQPQSQSGSGSGSSGSSQSQQRPPQTGFGTQTQGQDQDKEKEQDEEQKGTANESGPWNLYRIVVAVRAPSGRSTTLETYRLSRPAR